MFIIFTKPNCRFCTQAKEYFARNGCKYEEYNVYDRRDEFKFLFPEAKTVPQIIQIIGNAQDLINEKWKQK